MIEKCSLSLIMKDAVALQASPAESISLDFPISEDTHRWLCKSCVCVSVTRSISDRAQLSYAWNPVKLIIPPPLPQILKFSTF